MPFDPRVHVGVAGVLINPNRRLLMIRREGAHGAGQWSVPGGWIDHGETPMKALVREFKEEVGLEIPEPAHLTMLGTSTWVFEPPVDHSLSLFIHVPYGSKTVHPEIKEPDKISKLAWVAYDHIKMLDLFPPFEKFVKEGFEW